MWRRPVLIRVAFEAPANRGVLMQENLGDTAGATAPPVPAQAVRTFLFALSTDSGPKLLAFRMSNLLIGRLPDNHLALNHGSVSRRHARISVTNRGVTVEDMGSQNGTTVN